ncbi:DUF4116 domain-containing protein, partial [Roseibium sp. RKSG952]|uniref:DUF4116 domain-containing protein n=1 Tax=Roseibium sp. RKSG952 TaxID=2529384 RepID=UPI0012BBAAF7
ALRTEEMCREAVGQSGRALEYVPERLQTRELCLEAVRQKDEAFQRITEDLKSHCMPALSARHPKWVGANNLETLKHALSH